MKNINRQGLFKMASRLLFEDDIVDQGVNETDRLKTNEETMVNVKHPAVEDIYISSESHDSSMDNTTRIVRKQYSALLANVIVLGSGVNNKQDAKIPQVDGNSSQDEGDTSHDNGNTYHNEGNTFQDDGINSQENGNISQDEGNTSHDEVNTSQNNGNTSQDMGNISQEKGNISQDEVIEGTFTPVVKDKPKVKRRPKSELELLLLDTEKDEEDLLREYDVFGDENKIFKKYKLRKTKHTVSYKEPALIEPKRHYGVDNKTDLTCPVCKQQLENKVALLNHLRIHNKGALAYTCSLCSMKFDSKTDLIAHRQKHSGESFLCQECKLAFSSYCDYLLHNYEHLNQPHFKCSECGLRYRKSVYKQHIRTHFENKLSCNICSFVANGPRHLRNHLNQHSKKIICVECGKVFHRKTVFDYHMSMHTGVKKVQCLYCGACFRGKNARDVHHRTHTGEKPFTCDICGYKARQWTDLKRHKESHVTEKKYTCDLCGKKYLHKNYLVMHIRSHTKKSLYECPECDAKFVTVSGLKTHSMFKHTIERPVECAVCEKKFINYNQYRKHCRAKYHLRNVYGNNMSVNTKE